MNRTITFLTKEIDMGRYERFLLLAFLTVMTVAGSAMAIGLAVLALRGN